MILTLVIVTIAASLLRWSTTEQEITNRHIARTKARMIAEGVDQYGAAQIKARLDKLTYFADDEFRPGRNPIDVGRSTLVHQLLDSTSSGGIGQNLKQLKGGDGGTGSDGRTPSLDDGYFRYEITPDDLVVGRFSPARWERVEAGNPLYVGDPLIDQTIRVREVRMVSSAKAVDRVRQRVVMAYCESVLQVRDSPVWGNVLFYNMDLEIAPGASMEVHGPVHTNGNLYAQADHSLQFHDGVTAAGYLYHGRSFQSTPAAGGVTFKKDGASSEFVSLYQEGAWLDSRAEDWVTRASTLWAGNVRTREHGINPAIPAGLAPYTPDDPATAADEWRNPARVIIEQATESNHADYPGDVIEVQKFASKACLVLDVTSAGAVTLYKYEPANSGRFIRDDGGGARKYVRRQLTVPVGLIVGGSASDKFYDKRRGQWVMSLDLDVGRLKALMENSGPAAALAHGSTTFDPATEWNGIVYVSHANHARGGVRLVNGRQVPNRPTHANGNTAGFTLATDAPLYVLGHYNADGQIESDGDRIRLPDTETEPPAGLAADAVTILSAAWSDANSDQGLSQRIAQPTEIAAALLTGIVPTNKHGNGTYSGGVENLPRLLENWSGVRLGYRGSMVVLYESERATEPWGSSSVYHPPNRVWGFNALFASGVLPPGTPNSRTYRRIAYRDLSTAEYQVSLAAINAE
jgi:hypothetical protein